ncbi:MAG: PIG-L family deacetylase [Schleiferiaceae bacterium]
MTKFSLTLALAAGLAAGASAQPVQRILYVAAHPDDENTRLIAHWSRAEGREVAYVSLTRGEGGQNLIGPELGPALGVIREAELREARKIDGAQQFFTSAPDFGFSKNPEETFQVWDRELVLGELFALAAEFRPDVIVTRFPPDARAGHGHHTASAMLALDLFARLQRDRKCNGDWAPRAVYWNTSSWWAKDLESAEPTDSLVKLRIGGYHEALGKSVLQIGTEARSMHKSQGFGAVNDHGFRNEFLQLLAGQPCAWDAPRVPSERPPLHLWRDVLADRPWFTDRDSLPLRRWEVAVNESSEPFEVYGRLLQPGERAEFEANPLETAYCTAGDRVKGELRRPVIHADPLSVHVELPALVATHDIAYRIDVTFTRWALAKDFAVEVRVPKGWKLRSPNVLKWTAAPHSDRDQRYVVVVEPGANPEPGLLEFWSDGRALRAVVELRYDHIPHTEVWTEGGIPMRYLPMNLPEATVGVIEGAGDDAAEALGQLGFAVRQLNPRTMTAQDLNGLSAVVTGIRAFNATPGMDRANALLEPWIKAGGRLVMQYTTASTDRTADQMGPIPFELGRKRVTVESVPPTVLKPKHPIWTTPNTLTAADFEGWVQERGLYFAEKWPSDYTPLIEWSDPGEPATQGALITARYGQGSVTYCGLALFRQWREGVPGAYRILANLVAHEY